MQAVLSAHDANFIEATPLGPEHFGALAAAMAFATWVLTWLV